MPARNALPKGSRKRQHNREGEISLTENKQTHLFGAFVECHGCTNPEVSERYCVISQKHETPEGAMFAAQEQKSECSYVSPMYNITAVSAVSVGAELALAQS